MTRFVIIVFAVLALLAAACALQVYCYILQAQAIGALFAR